MSKLPLDGVRIADFSQVVQAPYATMLLGQMGAEVIKIETESRVQPDLRTPGEFTNLNGSKKSITLNLKDHRGSEIAKNLVQASHVVIENFGTGVMERFGLGYTDLRKVKPDIIMLSSQGWGRTGPLRASVGYWAELSNSVGFSELTGYKDERPGMVGAIWADHLTGMHIVFAILSALRHLRRTGEGHYIQMSLAETIIAAIPEAMMEYSVNGRDIGRLENRDIAMAPHSVYKCRGFDKWIAIAVTNEDEWISFCQATGHDQWATDERFSDPLTRWHNQGELDHLITEWTLQHTDYEVMHILQKAEVAAGPILTAEGLSEDPHLNERGCFIPLGTAPNGAPYVQVAHPWRLSDSPKPFYSLAPDMGQHNEHVLTDILGMSQEEIANLARDNVLS